MKIKEEELLKCLQSLHKFNNNSNKLPFQNVPELYVLHRLFVSAFYFKNPSCQKRITKLNREIFDVHINHYCQYYQRKEELKIIIRSLKFAIHYANKRSCRKK